MQDETTATAPATSAFRRLDPTRAPADQIHSALKSAILHLDLAPGQLVSEAEIAAGFGASRTPVREAFAMLREDGLIVTRPSRGNYVSHLSEAAIRQAQFLREALELANVTRLCDAGLNSDSRAALEACLATQARAVDDADTGLFHLEDDRFHALLARATGFPRAEIVLVREKAMLDRLRRLSLIDAAHRTRLLQEHRSLLEAIVARDVGLATDATRAHLRSVLGALSRMMQDHEGYFE